MTPATRRDGRLRGTSKPNAKLDDDKVRSMRARRHGGASWAQLARDFKVSERTVKLICTWQMWKHVV